MCSICTRSLDQDMLTPRQTWPGNFFWKGALGPHYQLAFYWGASLILWGSKLYLQHGYGAWVFWLQQPDIMSIINNILIESKWRANWEQKFRIVCTFICWSWSVKFITARSLNLIELTWESVNEGEGRSDNCREASDTKSAAALCHRGCKGHNGF